MQSLEPDKHILPNLADVLEKKKIGSGAYHKMYPVDVEIKHGTRQKIRRMVLRIPHTGELGVSQGEKIVEQQLEVRDALQAHGVPVVPTYRLVDPMADPRVGNQDVVRCVLATDLTRGGKRKVYSPTNVSDYTFPNRPNNKLFSQSRGIRIANADDLLEQAWASAIGITDAGYYLIRPDAFVFSLDDTGNQAFLVIGDYKHLNKTVDVSKDQAFNLTIRMSRWAIDSMGPFTGIPEEEVRDFFNAKLANTGIELRKYRDD